MKEKIEQKIEEIIDHIINKQPEDITYNEYCILDRKLSVINWEEEKAHNKAEYAQLIGRCFTQGLEAVPPAPLMPIETKED